MAFGGSATGTGSSISLTSVTAGATICVFPTDTNGNATAFTVSDAQGTYSARGTIQGISGDTSTQLLILTNANAGTHTISLAATGDTIVGGLAFWYTGVGDVDNSHNAIAGTHASVTTTANNGTSGSFTSTTNGCTIVGVAINLLTTAACTVGTSPFTFVSRATGSIAAVNGYRLEDAAQATAGSTNVACQYASGSHVTAVIGFALAPASSNVTDSLTGQTATFSEGTVSPALAYGVTGQSATFSEGTVAGAVSYALTGQTATFALGTVVPAISYPVTGQTATFTEGTISASLGGTVTLQLSGQTATFTEGTLAASVAAALSAQTATFTEGTLAPSISSALTGQSATFSEGVLAPSVSTALAGQTATFTEGTITPSQGGDVVIQLSGLQAAFTLGTISATGGDQPLPPVSQDAGGRIRPTLYFIEVEGKKFEAPTLADALNILAKVKNLAKQHALTVARAATSRAKPNKPVPPIRIPKIKGSEVLREAAAETQKEVRAIYESALRDAEIGMLIEIAKRRDEEEDTILLLM